MGRWEPDAAERLRLAARDLFVEQGFEETTVAQIAERAGLTPRTFFRYYPDKREVLFAGSDQLEEAMAAAARATAPEATAWDAVAAALTAGATMIGGSRAWSRQRQDMLLDHADLQGRELTKLARLATILAGVLRERGVADVEAELVAEAALTVFRLGFAAWLEEPGDRTLAEVIGERLDLLRRL
ncbi:TetR family transcriptional regulator [Nocardioides mangrovicus]|uniref:TetR family transcriptional regulator n=1 Tax=Nocardioides mangrovicus TaxID=2478913 RepID=A0A3L8P6W1_9ACTN|nr:TetR family transcriptional regulator [Nocardioides mangrovicus]RLV50727.1 TetR family transcriptional regulator [Nocardioides mangrovicus]